MISRWSTIRCPHWCWQGSERSWSSLQSVIFRYLKNCLAPVSSWGFRCLMLFRTNLGDWQMRLLSEPISSEMTCGTGARWQYFYGQSFTGSDALQPRLKRSDYFRILCAWPERIWCRRVWWERKGTLHRGETGASEVQLRCSGTVFLW